MRPIKLSKKEWGLAVMAVCLALASFSPDDPWVFVPLLWASWAACLYLAYHHEGRLSRKILFAFVVTATLGGIGYRDFSRMNVPPTAHVLAYWVGQNNKDHSEVIANVYIENGDKAFTGAVYSSAAIRLATTDNAEIYKVADLAKRDAGKKAAGGGGLYFPFPPRQKAWFTVDGPTFSEQDMKKYLNGEAMFFFAGEVIQQNSKTPVLEFCGFVNGDRQQTIFQCPLSGAKAGL